MPEKQEGNQPSTLRPRKVISHPHFGRVCVHAIEKTCGNQPGNHATVQDTGMKDTHTLCRGAASVRGTSESRSSSKRAEFRIARQAGTRRHWSDHPWDPVCSEFVGRPSSTHPQPIDALDWTQACRILGSRSRLPIVSLPRGRQRNATAAARWPRNQRRPVCAAKIFNDSRRPTARLNQRPNWRTVSIQRSSFKCSRSRIGAKWAGIVPRLAARI
jgi:hypothetical protein